MENIEEKKAPEKGGDETFVGTVNAEKKTAEFPVTMDALGKVIVPMHVRELLGIKGKIVVMQVAIGVRRVLE